MSIGRLTTCVEIDLRQREAGQARQVMAALDGLEPGGVVKLLVSRFSDPCALSHVNLADAYVQLTADTVGHQTGLGGSAQQLT
ncbi:hypothetical protein [Microbacterium sp. ZW T5_56]|uniref:hypothetical protein n=1 Tax=Microbacterium sp. ZW T5_56 TaxID=3378081 RepID=UPI003853072A